LRAHWVSFGLIKVCLGESFQGSMSLKCVGPFVVYMNIIFFT
jgi:hypothetical protein